MRNLKTKVATIDIQTRNELKKKSIAQERLYEYRIALHENKQLFKKFKQSHW